MFDSFRRKPVIAKAFTVADAILFTREISICGDVAIWFHDGEHGTQRLSYGGFGHFEGVFCGTTPSGEYFTIGIKQPPSGGEQHG